MPGLLQLQFGKIQAPLPDIGCARAVAVAVAVLADPGCSEEEGEFQGQPRAGPFSFDSVWLEMQDWQVTQVQFQQAQLVLAGIGGTRVVVAVAVWTDPGSSVRVVAVAVWADPGCSAKDKVPGLLLLQLQCWQIQAVCQG